MGILTDYFPATPEQARAAAEHGPGDDLDPVRAKFVEPSVLGGALWEAVRHGALDASTETRYADDERVDDNDDEGPYLLRLKPDFVADLAALPDDRIGQVAVVWATAEEWWGGADVEFLTELVEELRRVARAALADGMDAYCWICL
ncbi:hypothetical protein ONA70_06715 [Micromonospora yasonensis]|uniref:hypothetical protein n=1 Tax=Micromonospora yasonensis TaxID=1128667 RepID=UPI00222F17DD|nr:hypothetical protein [Micromonospora yasonensis]MCW3839787.1 hypothetical protein [Micromonospora yasonensis]